MPASAKWSRDDGDPLVEPDDTRSVCAHDRLSEEPAADRPEAQRTAVVLGEPDARGELERERWDRRLEVLRQFGRDLEQRRPDRSEPRQRQIQHGGVASVEAERVVGDLEPEGHSSSVQSRRERTHQRGRACRRDVPVRPQDAARQGRPPQWHRSAPCRSPAPATGSPWARGSRPPRPVGCRAGARQSDSGMRARTSTTPPPPSRRRSARPSSRPASMPFPVFASDSARASPGSGSDRRRLAPAGGHRAAAAVERRVQLVSRGSITR